MCCAFEERLREDLPHFALAESLRGEQSPDLRIIISDGRTIYFSLGMPDQQPKLFGGIPLEQLTGDTPELSVRIEAVKVRRNGHKGAGGLGPENSHFARLELSVTAIARELPVD